MNWVDLIILIVILLFAIEGFRRSFINEVSDLFCFLLAFVISIRLYNDSARLLQSLFNLPHSLSTVLGFVFSWFIVETLLLYFLTLILSKIKFSSWILKLNVFSFIPAILKSLVLISITLVFLSSFPIQPTIKKQVNNSRLGSMIIAQTQNFETPLKNIFGGISQDSLTFLTLKPETNETVDLGFKTLDYSSNESLENQMIILVNKERTKRGLNALTFDPTLRDVGRSHSGDMFTRGYFSHYSPEGKSVAERGEAKGVKYLVIGENLAYAPSLSLAHNGLMNSPGHRANILSPDFGKIGIGIMDGGEYGIMVTQVFTN